MKRNTFQHIVGTCRVRLSGLIHVAILGRNLPIRLYFSKAATIALESL